MLGLDDSGSIASSGATDKVNSDQIAQLDAARRVGYGKLNDAG
jgi:hypothetical protein